MKKEFLECGKIVGAHGVKGLAKVESWCDSPKILAAQKRVFLAEKDGSYKEAKIETASVADRVVLMKLNILADREAAQGMNCTVLYLHRDDIPVKAGEMLLADIIGLPVIDIDTGRHYGEVKDIQDSVASRLYTVATDKGDVLIPGIDEFIKEIRADEGVFVRVIPGFFD